MAETIVLDPAAVATSRTSVDISAFIAADGPDWGDAAIEGYMAQAERGDTLVDYRIPNRTVVIPLRLTARGGTSFETIRRNLQAKTSLFQREGGWLSRTTSVGTLYGDVVNATLRLGGDWMQANRSIDVNAVLTLELVPDWYGAEVSLDDKTETTLPTFTKVMQLSAVDAVVAGDYPGRVRIVVDEDQSQMRRTLLWGWRSRNYSSASTAALFYQAEALTLMGASAISTLSTASGGGSNNYVTHTTGTDWSPALSTQISAGSHLTHVGTYRVWARVQSTTDVDTQVRFVWDVGDLLNPTTNTPATISPDVNNTNEFELVDLGEVQLERVPVGTHIWQGVVQFRSPNAVNNMLIDTLEFQPIDDGAGRFVTTMDASPGLAAYVARDEFNQTAGDLTGKTAAVGGTWAEAGDVDGLVLDTTNDLVTRTAVSDAGAHFALAGSSTYALIAVQVDLKWSATGTGTTLGVLARYSSTASHVCAVVDTTTDWVMVGQFSGGSLTHYGRYEGFEGQLSDGTWYTIRAVFDAGGRFWVWLWATGGNPGVPVVVNSYASQLATGGVADDGQVGIIDIHGGADAVTRSYDNFMAWQPSLDAVLHSGQSMELRTDGVFREEATGASYGPIIPTSGGLPRIPVSGLESRKVELYLRGSRSGLDGTQDTGAGDDISARVHYRPSWLIAPGS